VIDYLRKEGLLAAWPENNAEPKDITKTGLDFPTTRSERLQVLTRGQTGAVTALGYASLRGYGTLHPTVGELRIGTISVYVPDPFHKNGNEEDSYYVGEIRITEVETIIPKHRDIGQGKSRVEFDIGYGICMGQNETKAIAMSILDQCLETKDPRYPTHDEEFVLLHIDSVETTGFISHLKLPHYVTFQSKLDSVRKIKEEQS
jgi:alpha-D-ribose 1-methylphosphonate 5-triphosphate synthase subunit PhnI